MALKYPIAIIGPTAIGKTAVAVSLAKALNGEIIGLDSRQIYKGMGIGTAQPKREEMDGIPHHLIGLRDPSESISAGEYAKLVKDKINQIHTRRKFPVICGGAGLYFRALTIGIFDGSVSELNIRDRLNVEYEENPNRLVERLMTIDPEYGEIVHINNKKRLVRALEIYESTGRAPSEHFKRQKDGSGDTLDLFSVLLELEKEKLNQQIELRTEAMLAEGWVDEVKQLIKYQTESKLKFPALDSIGYKQIQSYLNNEISYEEMKEKIIVRTRQFSRRQVQWFKKENIDLRIEVSGLTKFQIAQNILDVLYKTKGNTP